MDKPLVSVILSTYNRADTFLKAAIESVLEQTFKGFELIIIDDASTDNTPVAVTGYNDRRITYVRRAENSGYQSIPKNEGIKLARGRYIAYLDDDNRYTPDHLEVLVNALEKNTGIEVCYGDRQHIDVHAPLNTKVYRAGEFDFYRLINRNFIDTSDLMHTREVIYRIGGWNPDLKRFGDWDLLVRLAKIGAKFLYVPGVITYYYRHKESMTSVRERVIPKMDVFRVNGLSETTIGDIPFFSRVHRHLALMGEYRLNIIAKARKLFNINFISEARKLSYMNMKEYAARLNLKNARILDVGIAGNPLKGGYKPFFLGNEYSTLDVDARWKPDYVQDICRTDFNDESWDLVIFIQTLEHIADFREVLKEIHRILKTGGHLILETPYNYPFHSEPSFKDYWRFTLDGYYVLLKDFDIKSIGQYGGEPDNPAIVSALASKKNG